jgi:ribosome production factor 1
MPTSRFEPSSIKNKIKREEVAQKSKKAKNQLKLQKRLARAKAEANDPGAKKVRLISICEILIDTYFQKRLEANVPHTLDNMREFDPSILTANPSVSTPNVDGEPSNESQQLIDLEKDLSNDPFASYFDSVDDPTIPPKILITTSPKASKSTYDFCDELVGIFPGAEFIRRKKGKGFEVGRIAGWAADRGYKHLCVVNEDMKKPSQ